MGNNQNVYNCVTWAAGGSLWKNANWLWVECSSSIQPSPPITSSISVQPLGVDATTLVQPWLIEPWNPYKNQEKKKRLIKLICKVNGQTFEEEKEIEKYEISVDDIRMLVRHVGNINLDIKKIEKE